MRRRSQGAPSRGGGGPPAFLSFWWEKDKTGIDIDLWDLLGKASGAVCQLMGGGSAKNKCWGCIALSRRVATRDQMAANVRPA